MRVFPIGTTYEGREILAAVLTNFKTGVPENRPGFLLTGGLHAGELAGSEAAFYAIERLLYEDRDLLDEYCIYSVPVINADGRSYYMETPNNNIRGSTRDHFGEEPGVYEYDVDSDGYILTMRKLDPSGNMKPSELDSRLLVERRSGDVQGPFYRVWWEGLVRGENTLSPRQASSRKWLDPNRSFPFDWDENVMGP